MKKIVSILTAIFILTINSSFGQNTDQRMTVEILLFDGVQIIDYTGPYETLGYGFKVLTVSDSATNITTNMGMKVTTDYDLAHAPKADVIVLPGGYAAFKSAEKPEVIRWIQERAKDAKIVMSVCNGAFFLANAGLLDNMQATTTAGFIDTLQKRVPSAHVVRDKRFVDNGKIITTAGLSSGIDGSLHIAQRLLGEAYAPIFSRWLEYNWNPDSKYTAAQLADCNANKIFPGYLMFNLQGEPLKFEGDTKQWQCEVLIKTDKPISSISKELNAVISNQQQWTLKQMDESSNTGKWTFKGKDLHSWEGLSAITATDKKGEYKVRLNISRAD
jgi:putative intracellular protease/amidase